MKPTNKIRFYVAANTESEFIAGFVSGDTRFDSLFVASYLTSRPFNTAQWPPDPVAILPAYTNRRLVAQKGTFVLFGASSRHLGDMPIWETSTGPRLVQLIIPKEKVPAIRSALLNAGITAALLFPELSMLSTDILHDWCRK